MTRLVIWGFPIASLTLGLVAASAARSASEVVAVWAAPFVGGVVAWAALLVARMRPARRPPSP